MGKHLHSNSDGLACGHFTTFKGLALSDGLCHFLPSLATVVGNKIFLLTPVHTVMLHQMEPSAKSESLPEP